MDLCRRSGAVAKAPDTDRAEFATRVCNIALYCRVWALPIIRYSSRVLKRGHSLGQAGLFRPATGPGFLRVGFRGWATAVLLWRQ
jgi:hypothetical protein